MHDCDSAPAPSNLIPCLLCKQVTVRRGSVERFCAACIAAGNHRARWEIDLEKQRAASAKARHQKEHDKHVTPKLITGPVRLGRRKPR